jgi:hypoxanthine phosphoribosyltransferase
VSAKQRSSYSDKRISARIEELGKQISRAYRGRRVDVVVTMDRGFVFAADLLRRVVTPTVCHFVREEVRDMQQQGAKPRREVFFGSRPDLKGRDVLVLDAVMDTGVTQEFLLRRLGESQPRSLRLAVLLDKTAGRRVALEPDYFGFQTASNQVWVGYGLADGRGERRNERQLTQSQGQRPEKAKTASNNKTSKNGKKK